MKPVVLKQQPGGGDIGIYIIRGLVFLIVPAILAYFGWEFSRELRQYDRDGEIGVGTVTSVDRHTTRRRRGRMSVSYTLSVGGPHGILNLSCADPVAIGTAVRYIYSPTLRDAILAGPEGERGNIFRSAVLSLWWKILLLFCVCVLMLWMVYEQFKVVLALITKNYIVDPESEDAESNSPVPFRRS